MVALSTAPVEHFRHLVFDGWQRLMPRERVSDLVVVVAIDEKALATHGQWPWPRARVAELVSRIAEAGPLAIAIDIFFPEPDRYSPASVAAQVEAAAPELAASLRKLPSSDALLGQALGKVPSVLSVAGLDDPDPRFPAPPGGPPFRFTGGAGDGVRQYRGHLGSVPEVDAGAASHGLVSTVFEGGVARRVPVIAKIGVHGVAGLGVELVRLAVNQPLELRPAAGGLLELRFGEYAVPAQPDGRAYVRYGRSDNRRFVPSSDILSGQFDLRQLEGKLVLVGFTGLGLRDLAVTSLGESVHGVENHAQVAEAILEEQYLRRFTYAPHLEAALLAAFGLALVVFIPRTSAQRSALLLVAGVLVLIGAGAAAFRYGGLLFDPFTPSLAAVFVFGALQAGSLAEAQRQHRRLREQAARVAGEMSAAHRIQMGLLPDPRKAVPAEPRLEIAALIEPARTVGGDFYDCFMLDDRRLFFLVADVSGKGLPAALFMASAKTILKGAALVTQGRLGRVLARAQSDIRLENPESLFVTAFVAVLDLKSGYLEFVNAGHEPAWHRRPGERCERLSGPGGPPLCVLEEEFVYPISRLAMRPGEWLLVLSDGVTEATNPAGDFYGAQRLRESLDALDEGANAQDLASMVSENVRRFSAGAEPADDLTLLAIRWIGTPAAAG